jgi:hypothetical protein
MGIEVLLEEEDRFSSSATPEKEAMDPFFVSSSSSSPSDDNTSRTSSTGRLLQLPLRVADDSHEQENTKIEVLLDEEQLATRATAGGYKEITRNIGRLFKGCLVERVNGEEEEEEKNHRRGQLGVVEMDPFFAKPSLDHSHHQEEEKKKEHSTDQQESCKIEVLLDEEELHNNEREETNSRETEVLEEEGEEVLSQVNFAAATPSPLTITMYLNGANNDYERAVPL